MRKGAESEKLISALGAFSAAPRAHSPDSRQSTLSRWPSKAINLIYAALSHAFISRCRTTHTSHTPPRTNLINCTAPQSDL